MVNQIGLKVVLVVVFFFQVNQGLNVKSISRNLMINIFVSFVLSLFMGRFSFYDITKPCIVVKIFIY